MMLGTHGRLPRLSQLDATAVTLHQLPLLSPLPQAQVRPAHSAEAEALESQLAELYQAYLHMCAAATADAAACCCSLPFHCRIIAVAAAAVA